MIYFIRFLQISLTWQAHVSWGLSAIFLFACVLQEHLRYLSFDVRRVQLASI